MRRGRLLVAALLAGSAVLSAAQAWLRWHATCPVGGDWDAAVCVRRQDHAYDAVPAAAPWHADPAWSVLGGLALVLLAVAVVLLPLAVPVRRWQRNALVLPVAAAVVVGLAAILSGLADRLVEVPAHSVAFYLTLLTLPLALLLLLPGRALLVSALLLSTPLLQAVLVVRLLVPYSSHDTAPWSEAAVVPTLALAVVALWRAGQAGDGPG